MSNSEITSTIRYSDKIRRPAVRRVSCIRCVASSIELPIFVYAKMQLQKMKVVGINGSARKVYGKNIGDVLHDEEGMANMHNLGKNMSYILRKIKNCLL